MDKSIIKIEDSNFLEFLREEKVNVAICNEQGDYDITGSYIDANAEIVLKRTFLNITLPAKSDIHGSNKINSLEGIGVFKNLIALTCSGLGLEELPPLSPNLKTLNAARNKLKVLPDQPPSLTYLDVSGNKGIQLTSLGEGIKKLFCHKCSLEELPSFPSSMQYVECQNNNLKELPELPVGMINLNCDNNKIAKIGALPDSLEFLDCSYNELTEKPKHPEAYITCKGLPKKTKKVKSYFSGKKTDNFLLKLVIVNELIKTDEVLLDKINAIVTESHIHVEMMMYGYLSEVKRFIKKLVLSSEQLESISSLTFSRDNKVLFLLDPQMEEDVDDYDLKKFDGISELKNLGMVFLESGLKKSIKLTPLLDLKNVKKIEGDYFSKALYYFKQENTVDSVDTFDHACASFGDLSEKILERSDLDSWKKVGNGAFKIVYTTDSTVIISDGVREKLNMEFYVEIDGLIPFDELKNHFLISFLDNTIHKVINEKNFKKNFYTGSFWSTTLCVESDETDTILKEHKINAIGSYFTDGYFREPSLEEIEEYEEEYNEEYDTSKYINAILGIDSGRVPQFVSVKHQAVGLVSLMPDGRTWQNKSQIRRQLELTYGRSITPVNNYTDFGPGIKVTENTENELNDLYYKKDWSNLLDTSTELIDNGAISYVLFKYKALATEKLEQFTADDGVKAYKVCLEKFTGEIYPDLYLNIGDLLAEGNKYEESITYYNLYTNTITSLRETKRSYLYRGKSYAALKNYDAAIDDLTITYNYSRKYQGVNFLIPEYHLCNNQVKEAYDFLKHDLDIQRDDDVLIVLNLLFMLTSYLKKNEKEERRAFARIEKLLGRNNIIYYDLPGLLSRIDQGDTFDTYILDKVANFSFEEKEDE